MKVALSECAVWMKDTGAIVNVGRRQRIEMATAHWVCVRP